MRTSRSDRLGRLDGARKDASGRLKVPATPTRIGVFLYQNPDGSVRRELRHPDEVFKTDSLASASGIPVTVGHPKEPVTSANWKEHAVGHVADNVSHDERFVVSDLYVTDALAVHKVESGELIELSMGYECDFDATPGEWKGQRYDGVQRDIVYNHVALLPEGTARGGPEVRLHLDSGEGVFLEETTQEEPVKEPAGHLSTMDMEQLKAELAALKARCDALEAKNAKLEEEKATLTARADASDNAAKPEVIEARVQAAVQLREDARKVLGDGLLPKSDEEIMVAVITKRDPAFKKDSLTYPLRARFDAEMSLAAREALGEVRTGTKTVEDAKSAFNLEKLTKDMHERSENAWKTK